MVENVSFSFLQERNFTFGDRELWPAEEINGRRKEKKKNTGKEKMLQTTKQLGYIRHECMRTISGYSIDSRVPLVGMHMWQP